MGGGMWTLMIAMSTVIIDKRNLNNNNGEHPLGLKRVFFLHEVTRSSVWLVFLKPRACPNVHGLKNAQVLQVL